jgi:hypothetical protein
MSTSKRSAPRLSYANVASTTALVLAVGGGTAYAAGLVGTDDLAKGAVTTPKLAKSAVVSSKVKNGSIQLLDLAATPMTRSVVRTESGTMAASPGSTGQTYSLNAVCNAGETVLGGGFETSPVVSVDGQPNLLAVVDRPSVNGAGVVTEGNPADGWLVTVRRNSGNTAHTLTVHVLCGS